MATPDGQAAQLLSLQLSEGQSQTLAGAPTQLVAGEPLTAEEVQAIQARLPEWDPATATQQDFRWPTETRPRPRTGNTIDVAFPPVDNPPVEQVPTGPLEVLRFQPEGDVPVAPYVSITFNQPMVPVGTVSQLVAADVPATISPALEGTWQWIGTRTLRFDYTSDLIDRLPMATEYQVNIAAGTTSATGGALAQAVSFSFTTPPVTLQSLSPLNESLPLTPVFVATFDQRIDAAAVLATITLRADDNEVALRLATAAEVEADDAARQITTGLPDSRWLAFRPVDPLPTDAALKIAIGPGTPSAEGPRTTADAVVNSGRTYAPLRLVRASCNWGTDCPPGSYITLEFNNALVTSTVSTSSITVDPALPGMRVGASGNVVTIVAATSANTTYTVTAAASVADQFGQTLGSARTADVTIGSAEQSLTPIDQPLVTLDPFSPKPTLAVTSVNHDKFRLRVFGATVADWPAFQQYWLSRDSTDVTPPKWSVVIDRVIDVGGDADSIVETALDLSDAFGGKPGHAIVLLEPDPPLSTNDNAYWSNRPILTWVQSTSIGVDAVSDGARLVVWTTDLRTGAPLPGTDLSTNVSPDSKGSSLAGTTGADGVATLALAGDHRSVIATRGADTAILPAGTYGDVWYDAERFDEARWFVFDDRQTYRPGETMRLKGWVRRFTASSDAQLVALDRDAIVQYVVNDSFGNEIAKGNADTSVLGGFDVSVDIPDIANLGYAYVQLTLVGEPGLTAAGFGHSFQIQEFRRPEFEVSARAESQPPFLSTQPATVAVDATYYAGGPLAAAPVNWTVTTSTATYSPPGWSDFTFGIWVPWWSTPYDYAAVDYAPSYRGGECCGPYIEPDVQTFIGTTNADGTQYLQIDFTNPKGELPDLPSTVSAQVSVSDVNRQTWSGSTSLLVHPATLYVGLQSPRAFVREGEPLDIETIVTDVDGNAVPARSLTVTAVRVESDFVDGQWTEIEVDEQTCEISSGTVAVPCTFNTTTAGQYKVTSVVTDDQGGRSRSELTRWVAGADAKPSRGVEQQALTLVPDRAEYAAGDTAEVLVQSPFTDGHGLLTIGRNGIRSAETFEVVGGSAVVTIPIVDADIPGLDISIEVVGATPRVADDGTALPDAPLRPAYAVGQLSLSVPPLSRTLVVDVTPRDREVVPGAATQVDLSVTDAAGNPVAGAEVALVVVDEAVLALSGYTLGDPVSAFYSLSYQYLNAQYGRQSILLARPDELVVDLWGGTDLASASTSPASLDAGAPVPAGAGDNTAFAEESKRASTANGGAPIDVRTNFDALAVFEPEVITDGAGQATVDVQLPDSLTRYRVMAVAVSGAHQFGSGESTLTARLPVAVRPSAPRFANFGDTFELPVIVQNQTDAPIDVSVILQTSNLSIDGAAGTVVSVPANDRVEVRFAVSTGAAGTAAFRVAGVSEGGSDAASIELPVYTPTTAEAFATYGVIDEGAVLQPVLAPTDVVPQFGGLEVTTSSTSLQALTDAVIYISDYPYNSSDAMASRILSISALRGVLDAFDAEGVPSKANLDQAINDDIAGLLGLQNDDGGFPYWRHYERSEPFNSVQVAHAFVLARQAGYVVSADAYERAMAYVANIESFFPSEYSQEVRDSISAYALHVREVAGARDVSKAERLFSDRGDTLQLDAVAWLWPSIDNAGMRATIERMFQNRAVETAGAANFSTDYGDDAYLILNSDRRTDGIVLDALITQTPTSDLIPKVVTGLLANQVKGRWDNIQENAFILLALKNYFDVFEAQTPDFVAKVWLGDQFAGEHTFAGRETDRARISVPTAALIEAGDSDLVLAKDGAGRLYYRLGLRYAPADLRLDALDRGFVVDRVYEAVDDPADVTRDADGTWRIKAGARVRVRLTMVAESQRTHVALVDPLPAGLEILNPDLAASEAVPTDPTVGEGDGGDVFAAYDSWWWGTWYDHQNARDDRAEAFATFLPAGVHSYSYVARATTPGTFVAPPTRAEEMYAPETFGRTSTDRVVITD